MSDKNMEQHQPEVSIVIPMYNEVNAIERCIHSIQDQTFPQEKIEIIVVDGMSNDGSREKVKELSKKYTNLRLLNNPRKKTPVALNIGARSANGNVVVILGAHTRIDPAFVDTNIKYMKELDVKCTGGTQINVGETLWQHAIGHAMGSAFGIPSAPYRFMPKKQYVDTVVYAAYKKELFDKIGYFDEELHISEDAEFNWRIRKAGYKIFYTPEIKSYYYPRKSPRLLFKQFFNYGILRVNVIKKHLDAFKPIHILPPLFVFSVLILAISSLFTTLAKSLLLFVLLLYFGYLLTGSFFTVLKIKQLKYFVILPLIFATMHISWGLGFLVGLLKTY